MYWSFSKGAYVVADVDHECGATQYGFHDFDCAHDPKLASKFSLIGPPCIYYVLQLDSILRAT